MAAATIDEYLAAAPEAARAGLARIREIAHEVSPGATEAIKYGMPALLVDGRYVAYFAGWRSHLALYSVPRAADPALEARLAPLRSGADTVKLPLDAPLDEELVRAILRLVAERRARG